MRHARIYSLLLACAAASPSTARAAEEPGRLLLRLGAQGGAADEAETDATRFGGFQAAAGWHFRDDLLLFGELRDSFSNQSYVGLGADTGRLREQRIDGLLALDWRVAPTGWETLSFHLIGGPRSLFVRSEVYRPWMGTVWLGARIEAALHDGLVADAHGGGGYALFGREDEISALGDFKATWQYGAGVALRFAPSYRLRVGYTGETWVLDHTNRVQHGAEVSLQARWL